MTAAIREQAAQAVRELCDAAGLRPGQIVVVGCSTSEVRGGRIGTDSAPEDGRELGGSFATAAYGLMKNPVAVERIRADAGLDIGGTLIGMHLREVAVPVRLTLERIGAAIVLAARTRPRFIGGSRAAYDDRLL